MSHLCWSLASPWWLCRLLGSAMLPCGIAPCGSAPCACAAPCEETEPCCDEDEDEPVPTCPCCCCCHSTPPPGRSEGEAPAPRRLQALASSADSCGHSPLLMPSAVGEACPWVEDMTAARSADSCHSPLREPMPLGWLEAWLSRERAGKLARPMLQLFSCSIRSSTGAFG